MVVPSRFTPANENELAAKKLQQPLSEHLCQTLVFPVSRPNWKLVRVVSLSGRGPDFHSAVESLCREADGKQFPAVVDIYYERAVTAWSPSHVVRGTAVRFSDGFLPPPAPDRSQLTPPPFPKPTDEEPMPISENAAPNPPP